MVLPRDVLLLIRNIVVGLLLKVLKQTGYSEADVSYGKGGKSGKGGLAGAKCASIYLICGL